MALLGHGIVHSGLGQDEAVHAAEHGQNHAHGNHHGTCAAQQLLSNRRTQIQVTGVDHGGDLLVGQNLHDGEVEEGVENRNAADADDKGQGQILAGVLHFLGHGVQVGPALIGPEGGHNGQGDHAENAGVVLGSIDAGRAKGQVGGNMADKQGCQQNDGNGHHLGNHGDILHHGGQLHAHHVIGGDTEDEYNGGNLAAEVAEVENGLEHAHQSQGQSSHGAGAADEPIHKAVHEAHDGMKGLIQVDHTATGLGHGRAHFRIGQTAKQGNDTADDPAQQSQAAVHAHALQHIGAQVEDTGADHDTSNNANTTKGTYLAF